MLIYNAGFITSEGMKMLKKWVLLFGCLALISSASTFAALSQSSGAYVEGNLGTATKADWAGTLNFGYKFNINAGLELGYAHLRENFVDMAAKAIMPFSNGFELFAKLGPALQDFDINKIRFYGGVGGGYSFTPNLSGTLQGIAFTSGDYAATAGLTYIF